MEAWGKTYLGVSPYHPSKIDYYNNKFDLAGFSVGIVSKNKILSKKNVKENQKLVFWQLKEHC